MLTLKQTFEEREALCHMHDIEIDVIRQPWVDNSQFKHQYYCRLTRKDDVMGSAGRYFQLVEGLGLAEWWEAINKLLTS